MITAQQASTRILQHIEQIDVIPVLVLDDPAVAVDLAKVLVDAGLPVLEVTLRTSNALHVIEKMASVEGAVVAAGTVLNESHVLQAKQAGASFAVSPGYTGSLWTAASQADLPLLPGAATASEMMSLMEIGFSMLKFFPAETNGGIAALKSLGGPLPQMSFCPTGGVNTKNMGGYLELSNVACVGGSWLVTEQDVAQKDWRSIAQKAQALER
ncbi:MAG: bifunctional 4-hydroxy-2-oxoglutarate aldolase/2-dehydro-3-deoxy-phosphogluconate aldolase [Arenicella sp.]